MRIPSGSTLWGMSVTAFKACRRAPLTARALLHTTSEPLPPPAPTQQTHPCAHAPCTLPPNRCADLHRAYRRGRRPRVEQIPGDARPGHDRVLGHQRREPVPQSQPIAAHKAPLAAPRHTHRRGREPRRSVRNGAMHEVNGRAPRRTPPATRRRPSAACCARSAALAVSRSQTRPSATRCPTTATCAPAQGCSCGWPRLSPCAPPRRDALRPLMQPRPTRTTHCSLLPARRARVPGRRACSLAPPPTWLSQVLGKYLTLEDLRKAAPTQLKTA